MAGICTSSCSSCHMGVPLGQRGNTHASGVRATGACHRGVEAPLLSINSVTRNWCTQLDKAIARSPATPPGSAARHGQSAAASRWARVTVCQAHPITCRATKAASTALLLISRARMQCVCTPGLRRRARRLQPSTIHSPRPAGGGACTHAAIGQQACARSNASTCARARRLPGGGGRAWQPLTNTRPRVQTAIRPASLTVPHTKQLAHTPSHALNRHQVCSAGLRATRAAVAPPWRPSPTAASPQPHAQLRPTATGWQCTPHTTQPAAAAAGHMQRKPAAVRSRDHPNAAGMHAMPLSGQITKSSTSSRSARPPAPSAAASSGELHSPAALLRTNCSRMAPPGSIV